MTAAARTTRAASSLADAVRHTVRIGDLHGHRYAVETRIAQPAATQRVSLPVWIPGSYLVREFSRHLSGLTARQGGRELAVRQIDKCTWDIACDPARPLTLHYAVYAFDDSVRAAWLDARRGFFNATSLLLRAHGQEDAPHRLDVPRPSQPECQGWQLATVLEPIATDARGFGGYRAAHYDELADSPVELGAFWSGDFTAGGVPHRFVVAGAPDTFDGARLLADARAICAEAIRFWPGKAPFARYLFLLNAVDDNYGGLEHRASTALICARRNLPRLPNTDLPGAEANAAAGNESAASASAQSNAKPSDDYATLLGLISHEYFHAWNVKRLRPAEFTRYDYTRENYTRLLWFFEGFTSYYDDLLLLRAGRIDEAAYLQRLAKAINQTAQAPGRQAQSVAQASFDAWVRYYRPDENTPNSTISYYGKGALVALCLDLTLRAEGHATLDQVMCALWRRCKGGPMTEADFAQTLADIGGRPYDDEIARWIHGTDELPVIERLRQTGITARRDPAPLAQRLGLRAQEAGPGGAGNIVIKVVLDGGPAARAGMAAGDEWLGVEPVASPESPASSGRGARRRRATPEAGWRLRRLDDLLVDVGLSRPVIALVARGGRLLRLPLDLPQARADADNGVNTGVWRLLPRAPSGGPGGATLNESLRTGAPGFGMGCETQSAAIPGGIASICNEADRPKPGCDNREGLVQRCPSALLMQWPAR